MLPSAVRGQLLFSGRAFRWALRLFRGWLRFGLGLLDRLVLALEVPAWG